MRQQPQSLRGPWEQSRCTGASVDSWAVWLCCRKSEKFVVNFTSNRLGIFQLQKKRENIEQQVQNHNPCFLMEIWAQNFTFAYCAGLKSCPREVCLPSSQLAQCASFSMFQTCPPFYAFPNKALCKKCCYWAEACVFPSWMVKYWLTRAARRKERIVFPLCILRLLFTLGGTAGSTFQGVKLDAFLSSLLFSKMSLTCRSWGLCTVG